MAAGAHAVVRSPGFGEHDHVRWTGYHRPAAGLGPGHFERRPRDTHPLPTHADQHIVSLDRADGVPCPAAEPVASFDFQACPLERFDGDKIPKMVKRDCYGQTMSNFRRARTTASLNACAQ